MTATDLAAVQRLLVAELRRCGIRPAPPAGLGAWRWDPDRDEWIPVGAPVAPVE